MDGSLVVLPGTADREHVILPWAQNISPQSNIDSKA